MIAQEDRAPISALAQAWIDCDLTALAPHIEIRSDNGRTCAVIDTAIWTLIMDELERQEADHRRAIQDKAARSHGYRDFDHALRSVSTLIETDPPAACELYKALTG